MPQVLTRDEVVERLSSTEELDEIAFDYGGDKESFRLDQSSDRISFILGKDEHLLTDEAYIKILRMIGVAESLQSKFPPKVLLPLLNYYFEEHVGDMKCLLTRDREVAGFTKSGVQYVPNIKLLEAVEFALNRKFSNGVPLIYHHVHNDLHMTQFAVVSPRAEHIVEGRGVREGDAVNFGIQLQNSILGELPVVVSGYVYRLVCTNGMISSDSVFKFSRRIRSQTVPSWVEDACLQAADKAELEFTRLNTLADIKLDEHAGSVVRGLFREFQLSREQRDAITEQLVNEGSDTLYDVYNAITAVANDERVATTPMHIRQLQQAAGILSQHHEFCPSCYRTLN